MDPNIVLGVWTNQNSGRVLGLTLTIPKSYGAVLIALLALIVKWAGSRFWGILCFVVHLWRTNYKTHDALYYQHQGLLRSKARETDFLWHLYETSQAWRSHTPKPFRRSLPLGILALVNLAAFVIAGAFSAKVTVTDGYALVTGLCGEFPRGTEKPFAEWTKNEQAVAEVTFVSAYNAFHEIAQQVQLCYANPFFNGFDSRCSVTEVRRLDSVIDRNATCPFAENVCSHPAIKLDSGFINADSHLGINLSPSDNLQVRKITTCAPLNMSDYVTEWTNETWQGASAAVWAAKPGDTYVYIAVGPALWSGSVVSNFTFIVSNYSLWTPGPSYTLQSRVAFPKNLSSSEFIPVPALARTDADVSILALTNRGGYTEQIDDPFFEATYRNKRGVYLSNSAVTAIGCTEQYQVCNPTLPSEASSRCSQLGSLYELNVPNVPENLRLNARQQAIFRILGEHLLNVCMSGTIGYLGGEVLVANKLVWGANGLSTPLPSTQWQTEVENLHNISLSGLQLEQIYFAAVPNTQIRPGLTIHDHIVPRTDPDEQYICRNQRMRSTRASSFNLFGIFVIITVSVLIFLIDWFLPAFVRWLSRTHTRLWISFEAWQEDDILHIQRTALENQGIGPWEEGKNHVPVTSGWNLRFRRGIRYDSTKHHDSALLNGFQKVSTADNEGDVELIRTPAVKSETESDITLVKTPTTSIATVLDEDDIALVKAPAMGNSMGYSPWTTSQQQIHMSDFSTSPSSERSRYY